MNVPDMFGLLITGISSLKGFIFISMFYVICCICYPKIDGMMNFAKLSNCMSYCLTFIFHNFFFSLSICNFPVCQVEYVPKIEDLSLV